MSGFEIAGLVLGGFPLLVEAAKGLRGVFQDVGSWWSFEREFETFILNLQNEHIAFRQILKLLLDPIEKLSQDERRALSNDLDSPLWSEFRIQTELEHRVQAENLDWFMTHLRVMNSALSELHSMLPFRKEYLLDSGSLESEMFRVKTSFRHKKDRLLSEICATNLTLYAFLDRDRPRDFLRSSMFLPATTKGSGGAVVTSLLEFQQQCKSVFLGFQKYWTCTCATGYHSCRISTRESHVRVLLNDGAAITHVKVDVEKTKKLSQPSTTPSKQVSTKYEDVAVLRKQVSQKNRLCKLKEKMPKSILKMTVSTLSSLSNPAGVNPESSQIQLEKTSNKMKKRPNGVTGAFAIRTAKVQFDSDPPPCTPGLDRSATEVLVDQEDAINDMCLAIKKQEPYLGFLEIEDARLLLYRDAATQLPEIKTLEQFIDTTPRRDVRLKLGLSITSSILKLGPSWIPENWHRSSLVLLQTTEPLPYPYISHPAIHDTLKVNIAAESSRARASLFTVGVLLLELLFRSTLERQPFRAKYLDDGHPNDMTDMCTAMTWQKKVGDEHGEKMANVIMRCVRCDFGPAPDLGSSAFVRAVWLTVVKPLEEFVKVYSNEV